MKVRHVLAMLWDATRTAFRDPPNTIEECAHDLYLFLTRDQYNDYMRTQRYYEDIIRFVREWQPAAARQM